MPRSEQKQTLKFKISVRIMKPRLCAMFLCCIWSNILVPSDAIIIHPNVPDSKYVESVAKVPFFVSLGQRGDCAGSVVTGSSNKLYVLSAAHCFCANRRKMQNPSTVIFSDGSKVMIQIILP